MKVAPAAAVFGMLERGHFQRLVPVIAGLVQAGLRTQVFTDRRYRAEVERVGGLFVDLFAARPLEAADATSIPVPCRYVSFAGHYADEVVAEAQALQPSLIVNDGFAVVGAVVARRLRLPRVHVCVGHNLAPAPTLERYRNDPRVAVSADCWRAVRTLRERCGMPDASPFSYLTELSPQLNLYCEPPQYLREDERRAFEPLAFFGSLSEQTIDRTVSTTSAFIPAPAGAQRIYVSFGTVIWRYYEAEARAALGAICEALGAIPEDTAVVSLGGARPPWAADLERPNVRVANYVDQWNVLREASVFITHHGLNSTHEAVFHGVPMVSYPFFGDQQGLAQRCQELGLALPLVSGLRASVSAAEVLAALARVAADRPALEARLAQACTWELETIAARDKVIRRILELLS
jgi:MGT family glycosyltransferase